ncbi:hypothetical protein DAMA08_016480 [Martiniozyma asiatica (nom. inval.)]|nr:hypothetical protein DAMA08_016480 [Martiniozyma asiatica]
MNSGIISGVTSLLKKETNGAADGTGIVELIDISVEFLRLDSPSQIPSFLVEYVKGLQQAQFGSYPDSKDVAPSALFLALFAIIAIAHGGLFAFNWSRGHKFLLSALFSFYATLRWLGFALRIVWAKDILKLHVGIASEVLLVLPIVFLASFNLVLAQRLFTWRHPIIGNDKYFWFVMILLYIIVTAVVVMTIVAGVVPYLYLLSQFHYDMCRNVVKVTSILICLYSLISLGLILVAFFVPTTQAEKEALVYQPFWVKSFSPFYFTKKNAQVEGECLFMQNNANDDRRALRTIVGGGASFVDGEDEDESKELAEYEAAGDSKFTLKHNVSIIMVTITSIFVFIGALFRCIACFLDMTYATQSWIFKPVVMYVLWGALEVICNVIYLVGRIDLRFYRPDSTVTGIAGFYTADTIKESTSVEESSQNTHVEG